MESDHLRVIRGGLVAFTRAPLLGVGPANYRSVAPDMLAHVEGVRPDNHPHNFVIQLLAETGVIGTLFGCTFLFLICLEGWRIMRRNPADPMLRIAFVVPFALFWPLTTQSDFFGQWNNIFIWFAVAFVLAFCNLKQNP